MFKFSSSPMRSGFLTALVAAVAITAGVARAQTGTDLSASPQSTVPTGFPIDLADVVDKVSPAVVNIQVTMKGRSPRSGFQFDAPEDLPPGLREFFRRYFGMPDEPSGDQQQRQQPRRRPEPPRPGNQVMALGSGFIIDADGDIVTNNHVVADADSIAVTLKSGEKLTATLVGRDERMDLALLRVKSDKPLPFVSFGDSESMRVGNWVFTVGNPFGLGHTVTTGIISARGRTIGAGPYDDFLQIDAPINQGNSGGPAFNLKGDVIGINTAIFSPSGGSVGIGFAIPANLAKDVIGQLKQTGTVSRGWIGVEIQGINDEIAEGLGLKNTKGALVARVEENGPAEAAGVKQGDVIIEVNGKAVNSSSDLPRMIAFLKPGDKAALTLWRAGKTVKADLTLGNLAEHSQEASQPTVAPGIEGMSLAAINDQTRMALGLDPKAKGVVVIEVAPGSEAEHRGIQAGDVITRVASEAVTSPEDVAKKISEAKAKKQKSVLMLITREARQRFVALPIGAG